jgi:predicted DNA-binding ribbon-helix-helix protein
MAPTGPKRVWKNRSLRINGRNTSISVENEFWKALGEIANERAMTRKGMVAWIDANRTEKNLSSAVRLFVLAFYHGRVAERKASLGATGSGAARRKLQSVGVGCIADLID